MRANSTNVIVAKLIAGAAGMFVFAIFVLPPLYDVFCEVTGLGGKTSGPYVAEDAGVDTSRTVKVQFIATNNATMPWGFEPITHEVVVNPGQPTEIKYLAENSTQNDMVAQAIPSVTPIKAAEYFHKTECFCFNQQPLEAGAKAELPLVFIVDKDLPESVNTITLAYTLFDITDRVEKSVALN